MQNKRKEKEDSVEVRCCCAVSLCPTTPARDQDPASALLLYMLLHPAPKCAVMMYHIHGDSPIHHVGQILRNELMAAACVHQLIDSFHSQGV